MNVLKMYTVQYWLYVECVELILLLFFHNYYYSKTPQTECESVLPIQSLADFCFRRTKIATSVQELSLS